VSPNATASCGVKRCHSSPLDPCHTSRTPPRETATSLAPRVRAPLGTVGARRAVVRGAGRRPCRRSFSRVSCTKLECPCACRVPSSPCLSQRRPESRQAGGRRSERGSRAASDHRTTHLQHRHRRDSLAQVRSGQAQRRRHAAHSALELRPGCHCILAALLRAAPVLHIARDVGRRRARGAGLGLATLAVEELGEMRRQRGGRVRPRAGADKHRREVGVRLRDLVGGRFHSVTSLTRTRST
jgi:hypothetical protein